MWRVLRYASRQGFSIEHATARAIETNRMLLSACSGSRLYEELNKDLASGFARELFRKMTAYLILSAILGDLAKFARASAGPMAPTDLQDGSHQILLEATNGILRDSPLLDLYPRPQVALPFMRVRVCPHSEQSAHLHWSRHAKVQVLRQALQRPVGRVGPARSNAEISLPPSSRSSHCFFDLSHQRSLRRRRIGSVG